MLPRSQIVILTITSALFGLVGACTEDLEYYLEGQPCTVPEDCWDTQVCLRTPEEESLNILGLCRPEGSTCVFGAQLGCECHPIQGNCLNGAQPTALDIDYPLMVCDETLLRCVLAPEGGI